MEISNVEALSKIEVVSRKKYCVTFPKAKFTIYNEFEIKSMNG